MICLVQKQTFLKYLGKHLRGLRVEKGLTQRELAFACGKDPQSLERIENGKSNPTAYYLYELSIALNLPLASLLNFDSEGQEKPPREE